MYVRDISVPQAVKEIILSNDLYLKAVKSGIANYTAIANQIQPDVESVTGTRAKEVHLIPLEELEYSGFKNFLGNMLNGRVISRLDIIPINLVGKRIDFLVNFVNPGTSPLLIKHTTKNLDWYF